MPFPLVASLAPLVGALLIWAVTRSPFALLFALLGPIVAVGALADGRIGARRRLRRERRRFDEECAAAQEAVILRHEQERRELDATLPTLSEELRGEAGLRRRWGPDASVRIGTGARRSSLRMERNVADGERAQETERRDRLIESVRVLEGAPIGTDARRIGVVASPTIARAIARALLLHRLCVVSPSAMRVEAPAGGEWSWLARAPHPLRRRAADEAAAGDGWAEQVAWTEQGEPAWLALREREAELPPGCEVVVVVDGAGARLLRHSDAASIGAFEPELCGLAAASAGAALLFEESARLGSGAAAATVPERVALAGIEQPAPEGLRAVLGVGAHGPLAIDLLRHGPHALVAGTTGSGKSELLVSWVLAMAGTRAPDELAVLLVDFKGGAAFAPLEALPHVVGVITDLDASAARRALESLRAETRRRERLLAEHRARSIAELEPGRLARLVVIIDEFAAMMQALPELEPLIADLAARGRSLGIHLVLCTQRPAGAVRDGVLANAALRIALRVMSEADSSAVVGVPAAAALPAARPGRAIVLVEGETVEAQMALPSTRDAEAVRERWADAAQPFRPWLPPLSAWLDPRLLPGEGLALGLLDVPEEQRRDVLDLGASGPVLVLGGAGSGRTGAVAAAQRAAQRVGLPVRRPGRGPRDLWRAIEGAELAVGASALLLDDLDLLLDRLGEEHRLHALDRLARLLREAPARGLHVLVTAQRPAGLGALVQLCRSRVLLRIDDRQEHALAGGAPQLHDPALPPGAGTVGGRRLQLALVDDPGADEEGLPECVDPRSIRAIAGADARRIADRWCAADPGLRALALDAPESAGIGVDATALLVGDLDDWNARWGLFARLAQHGAVLITGGSLADVRSLLRPSVLPPPVAPGEAWLAGPEGIRAVALEAVAREHRAAV
ncbi:FtsK/SpoIIIE domain-containing protein [Arenivirga flava]|nr:FtsK/SpoIIIE domain-containing protein [Arenivirga flava]